MEQWISISYSYFKPVQMTIQKEMVRTINSTSLSHFSSPQPTQGFPRRVIDGLIDGWQILKARYGLGEPDPAVVEKARTELEPTLDIMAHRLSVAPYFAGENFSLADIAYMPEMDMLIKSKCQDMVDARPPLAAWWQRVSSRPSWLKVDAINVDKGTKPFDD